MRTDACKVIRSADLHAELPLPATATWTQGTWDIAAFGRRGIAVLYFAPRGDDHQQPHEQDELYFVIAGTAAFTGDGEVRHVTAGDMIFVPAYMPHRFTNISDDFATWAVFFGSSL